MGRPETLMEAASDSRYVRMERAASEPWPIAVAMRSYAPSTTSPAANVRGSDVRRSASTAIPPWAPRSSWSRTRSTRCSRPSLRTTPPTSSRRCSPVLRVRHVDPLEVVRPDEHVELPPGHLGDATLRPDAFDEVPSRREVGRAVNKRHRRPRLGELQRVEHGAVPAADDRHRQAGESGQMRLDQVGHVPAE